MNGNIREMLGANPNRVILLDGGMGSSIEDRGIDVNNALWGSFCFLNDQGREINQQVHGDFAAAGAEILITNTHNVRLGKCKQFLTEVEPTVLPDSITQLPAKQRVSACHRWMLDQATQSARDAIANQAIDRDIAIAICTGSIEPLGAYATESQISKHEACTRLEAEFLARRSLGPELIIFETLTTKTEIQGLAMLSAKHDLGDFAIGLTCGPDANTLAGVSMVQAVEILQATKPLVYFIQCTPFDQVLAPLEQLSHALGSNGITGVYANDGRVWANGRWTGQRAGPQAYADEAIKWKQHGARVIGGCCGTGPAHIRQLIPLAE